MSFRYITLLIAILVANFIHVQSNVHDSAILSFLIFYIPIIGLFVVAEKTGINNKKVSWLIGCTVIIIILLIDLLVIRFNW